MNHPLPIQHEHEQATAMPHGAPQALTGHPLDDGAGKTIQWLYEQWLAKDVAASAPRRE